MIYKSFPVKLLSSSNSIAFAFVAFSAIASAKFQPRPWNSELWTGSRYCFCLAQIYQIPQVLCDLAGVLTLQKDPQAHFDAMVGNS